MALMCSKHLFLEFIIKNNKNINSLLGSSYQCFVPLLHYSQHETRVSNEKLSKAMESYLEKSKKYDEFLKEQLKEYELGKKFLAGMMGKKKEQMSQSEVDKAVEFLFPSALFNKYARPKFKAPEEVFEKKKPAQFDYSGRPFHFLYYTSKPNYSQVLHDSAKKLLELQLYEEKLKKSGIKKPEKHLLLDKGDWITHKELEKKCLEKLSPADYETFIELFTRLANHPFGYMAEDMIKKYVKKSSEEKKETVPVAFPGKDGVMQVVIKGRKKTALSTVTVLYPGNGKIRINDTGLDYFLNPSAREQVLFPLLLTEMESRVDITATVTNGGEMCQAIAVRYGIAQGLNSFVSEEMSAKMKLAGLLQKDFRKPERKKVGREGARRGYTWLKR